MLKEYFIQWISFIFVLMGVCNGLRSQEKTQDGKDVMSHPRLIFNQVELPGLKQFIQTTEGKKILARLDQSFKEVPMNGISIGSFAAGYAFQFILGIDPEGAKKAQEITERAIAGVPYEDSPPLWSARDYKMIFRTKAAVDIAIAYDLCYHEWPEDFSKRVAGELAKLAQEFLRGGGQGFNSRIYSNWIGNTKAAAGFLALAIMGDPGVPGEVEKVFLQAKRDFFVYLDAAFGDRGWCGEGWNYLRYPMTTSGFQFLQALTLYENKDVVTGTPAEWILPLYIMQLVAPRGEKQPPYLPFFGLNYPFPEKNVTGFDQMYERTCWRSGDLVMGLGSVSEKYRAAALWTIHRTVGEEGDRTFDIYKPADAIYAVANLGRWLQKGMLPENPERVLPRVWIDSKFGYFIFRQQWEDWEDSVVAIYANAQPRPASYSFQDAGSFRIYAFGTRWAEQGSRKDRNWSKEFNINRLLENIVYIPDTNGWPGGKVLRYETFPDGSGIVSLDLSSTYAGGRDLRDVKPSGIRAWRGFCVDYSGRSGAPVLLAVVDRIEGGGEKTWLMHTGGVPEKTDRGFRINGDQNATLEATFLSPANPNVLIQKGRETHLIQVRGGDEFIVIMTIQKGTHPRVEVVGEGALSGKEIKIGGVRMSFPMQWIELSR